MIHLEEAVVRKLKTVQHVLCTVESCTGGQIANLITNVAGASEVYWGSFITYDNSAKEELGVPRSLLLEHGAVSAQTAQSLAEQGLKKLMENPYRKDSLSLLKPRGFVCVATTGIAGPSGGSTEKPIGLCYIGLAVSGRKTQIEVFQASAQDRIGIKAQFSEKTLELIRGSF